MAERIEMKAEKKRTFKIEGSQPLPTKWLKEWFETLPDDSYASIFHYNGNSVDPGYTMITVVEEL